MNIKEECDKIILTGIKPSLTEVLPIIKEFYKLPGNGVGGKLHIVLDDGNTHNTDIEYCITASKIENDKDAEMLGTVLLMMSQTQRNKIHQIK